MAESKPALIEGLHDRAGHLARRFQQKAVAHFTLNNGSFGLTSVQYAVLWAVKQRPGLDQSALATLVAFDKSTLGVVIDKLEQPGILRRTRDAIDKRRYSLRIASKGSRLLESMQASVWNSEQALLSPLSATEQKTLKSLLNKMLQGAAEKRVSKTALKKSIRSRSRR